MFFKINSPKITKPPKPLKKYQNHKPPNSKTASHVAKPQPPRISHMAPKGHAWLPMVTYHTNLATHVYFTKKFQTDKN